MNSRKRAPVKEYEEFKELQEFKNAVRTRPPLKANRSLHGNPFAERSFQSLGSSNSLNSLNSLYSSPHSYD